MKRMKGVLPGEEGWAENEECKEMKGMKGVLPGERGMGTPLYDTGLRKGYG